jgi:SPP1 gp7 family putative phage head morphogenesis protein
MSNITEQTLFDVFTQHQAYLYRASSRTINEIYKFFHIETLNMLDKLAYLLKQLDEMERLTLAGGEYTTHSLKNIQYIVSDWFNSISIAVSEIFTDSATSLAIYETNYMAKLFGKVIKDLEGKYLYKLIKRVPLAGGALMDESLNEISENALQRVEYAIRDGMNTGMTSPQIIKRISGTKRLKYEDGLLNSTKIDIERTIRTLRSHISNQVYLYNFKNFNFEYVRFVSVLDGRTSKVCAAVDGSIWKLNDPTKKVPPLHPHCRSILVPVNKDGRLIGSRSFIMDERRVRDIPKEERTQLMGHIDANISFKEFFKLTDNFFQKEWLGPKRYKLYKEGQFDFDKFFDPKGRLYTLDELRELDERAFKILGL